MSIAPTGRTLFRGGTVLTLDPHLGDFRRGDVLIEGARIAAVGPDLKVDDAEIVDARDAIVLPGLVDAHRHAWQGALRRLMPNVDSLDAYVDATHYTLGKFYRPDDIRPSPWDPDKTGFIGVWSVNDNGDVPPRGVIKGPASGLVWPAGVAINPMTHEVYTIDSVSNALFTFSMSEFFLKAPAASSGRQ